MARPLSIGWLAWGDETGGVASAVLNNMALLASLGQAVALWSIGPGPLVDAVHARGWCVHGLGEPAEVHRRYAGYGFSPLGLLRRATVVLRLRRVLRSGLRRGARPDVLCLAWPDLIPLAGPVTMALHLPLVLEMPAAPSRYRFDLNQRVYAAMTRRWRVRILANSDYTAGRMARVPDLFVVTPAVDAQRFDPARVAAVPRAALGLPDDAEVMGLIARLDPAKGADLAVAALAELAAEAPRLHLLLVGGPVEGAYPDALRAQIAKAGLDGRVHWTGAVSDPERYWGACDLALSTYKGAEAFGLSVVEAMLMQKPVIAHAAGQPGATVEEGRSGWLFHAPTAAALAEALRRALSARHSWTGIGKTARERARQRFADPGHGARYLSLLREHVDSLAP